MASEKELENKGISKESVGKILDIMKIKGEPEKVLDKIEKMFKSDGIGELRQVIGYLRSMKVKSAFVVDLSLARGQDYYTGPIFEIYAGEDIGSLSGGGRYDKMIGILSGKEMPATGIGIGFSRIIEVIKERKMMEPKKTNVGVFVIGVNEKMTDKVVEIVQILRDKSIPADYDLRFRSMSKQMNYANLMGIPKVIIVGEKELKANSVSLKNMQSGEEKLVKIDDLTKTLVRN